MLAGGKFLELFCLCLYWPGETLPLEWNPLMLKPFQSSKMSLESDLWLQLPFMSKVHVNTSAILHQSFVHVRFCNDISNVYYIYCPFLLLFSWTPKSDCLLCKSLFVIRFNVCPPNNPSPVQMFQPFLECQKKHCRGNLKMCSIKLKVKLFFRLQRLSQLVVVILRIQEQSYKIKKDLVSPKLAVNALRPI